VKTFPQLIMCDNCDCVYRRIALAGGERARCECCGTILYSADRLKINQWLALTAAAAIVFLLANAYPVIRISLKGLHNEATLWQSVAALAHGEAAPIAMVAALTVIVVPLLQIVLLGWVLLFAWRERRAPAVVTALKVLTALRPWSMLEVFLLGVLVAIVKLSSYLTVVIGVGVWATAASTVLITIIASREIHWLWELADEELE
jgi:paraquat-inducible protein A